MVTALEVQEALRSSYGTEHYFKRYPVTCMVYTDGVFNFCEKCEAHWFVDVVCSHMPAVIENHKETEDTFYMVKLFVKENHKSLFQITREIYNEEVEQYEEVVVAEQDLEYTDLPKCEVKMYLELAQWEPPVFCLLCPSEH